ncbi:hypothetical protein [Streptomyces cinnamoneus]|uniref:Secreted protein n=1 Tax=Streptomyces cinnamoneus TaxID=53446 RepID=A0A918WQN2_STRCJ|nr:hypothetical protein [Streptomyces cinnamoneus]GHC65051.1 hypothetical protein GCM10010507_48200 [Streptomyces cinnamoneus]
MTRVRKFAVAAAAVGVVVAPMAAAGTAHAGSNGQHVAVSTYYSDRAQICGTNQNGDSACTSWFKTPGNGYTKVSGYWWKGKVYIYGVNDNTGKQRIMECIVPKKQSSDWYYCDGRSHKEL